MPAVELTIPQLNQIVRALGNQLDRDRDAIDKLYEAPCECLDIHVMALRDGTGAYRAATAALLGEGNQTADDLWKGVSESELRFAWGDR